MGEKFESGELTDAADPRCAHLEVYDWANLLTRWMRQLAEPLVPNDDRYDAAVDLGREQLKDGFWGAISDAQVRKAQDVLDSLPVAHKAIIVRLVRFLRHLDAQYTQMTPASVALSQSHAQLTEWLTSKANVSDVESLTQDVSRKVSVAELAAVSAALSSKAEELSVAERLAEKMDRADVLEMLSEKANASAVTALQAGKADATTVDALSTAVAGKVDQSALKAERIRPSPQTPQRTTASARKTVAGARAGGAEALWVGRAAPGASRNPSASRSAVSAPSCARLRLNWAFRSIRSCSELPRWRSPSARYGRRGRTPS